MTHVYSHAVLRAKELLSKATVSFLDLETLAETLKASSDFGLARRLFRRARIHPDCPLLASERLTLAQQECICIYKDPDLPAIERFERAFRILDEADPLDRTQSQESLGLAGAIFKRRWEVEGQLALLHRSLGYYMRGYHLGATKDYGYTAGNAAFVLDLLALEESEVARRSGIDSTAAAQRVAEARRIRLELLAELPPLLDAESTRWLTGEWWFSATLAEAHFGLGRYEEAVAWLRRGPAIAEVKAWEFESTVRQLGSLARLHARLASSVGVPMASGEVAREEGKRAVAAEEARAWNALTDYLGPLATALSTAFVGKVGVALSGGGFRASLFHIGVLAHLAERDVLRSVEALSCVSGGSIVGAHYYLELRHLLQTKDDLEITRQDYIDLVRRVERDFLAGVQTNIRCQVLADVGSNLRTAFWPHYTRTHRLGELYEERIYSLVADGKAGAPRYMSDLLIEPKGSTGFNPKADNWRRRCKVPTLVLNATTLNTGHNWQFTATWMGEPPAGIDNEIDGNDRFRRMYYNEAPPAYQQVRLGHAVAASSCVPGLFDPLTLPDLYPDRTVRLVDGGVYDNQGTQSLLEQDCSVLFVSDASGQMESLSEPSAGHLGVTMRSFSVSMARVRQAEYHELDARRRSGLLRGMMFVHLKKDLQVEPVNWIGRVDEHDSSHDVESAGPPSEFTPYGISKEVQRLLSSIRTDLDSFTEVEAQSLMTSGYLMAVREFQERIDDFPSSGPAHPPWEFLGIRSAMEPGPAYAPLLRRLKVGQKVFFKVWWTSVPLIATAVVVVVGLVVGVLWAWRAWRALPDSANGLVNWLGWAIVGMAATLVVGPTVMRIIKFRGTLRQFSQAAVLSVVAALVFRVHLRVFDPVFLRWGRVQRIFGRDSK